MSASGQFPARRLNRPDTAYAPAASRRFDTRLTDAQLDAWRTFAAELGVSVADMVRAAVDLAASLGANHVRDYIAQQREAQLERASAELRRAMSAVAIGDCTRDDTKSVAVDDRIPEDP